MYTVSRRFQKQVLLWKISKFNIPPLVFIFGLLFILASCTTGTTDNGIVIVTPAPVNLAKDVAVNAPITANFSTIMNPATITSDTFTVSDSERSIPGSVSYSGNTATFMPLTDLAKDTTYTATISDSAETSTGTRMPNAYSWTFTTVSSTSNNPGLPVSQEDIEFVGPMVEAEDTFGNLKLLGEVTNTGNVTASFIEIECSFFDSSSNLIGEDTTYVIGSVIKFTAGNITTNTGLEPADIGVYELMTTIKRTTVVRYDCGFTYSLYDAADPLAKLESTGKTTAQSDLSSNLELLGQVKNTGTTGLTFGRVYFILRDRSGSIIDVSYSYIKGETVNFSSGTTTDTALRVNGEGTFSVSTTVPYNIYGSYESMFDWDDTEIVDAGITKALTHGPKFTSLETFDEREQNNFRNQSIEKLKEILAQKN